METAQPSSRQSTTGLMGILQGRIKLPFLGRGQLVLGTLGTLGLELQGQAVPAPVRSALERELEAALEDRWIVLGQSHQRKLLVVVHTERGDSIRIISARRAGRRERKSYEESN